MSDQKHPEWHKTLNWGLLYNKYFLTSSNADNRKDIGKEVDTTRFFSLVCNGRLNADQQLNKLHLLTAGKKSKLKAQLEQALCIGDSSLTEVCKTYTQRQTRLVMQLLCDAGLADDTKDKEKEREFIKTVTCNWRFVNGLSIPHLLEVNLFWHPTLGIPYLPGSALKGILKSFLMNHYPTSENGTHDEEFKTFMNRVFGSYEPFTSSTESENEEDNKESKAAGDYIFFDALPTLIKTKTGTRKMKFVTDVMTPHFGDWYLEGGKDKAGTLKTTPNDWHDPVPIPFLALEDFELQFAVVPRPGATKQPPGELAFITNMLCHALSYQGAGAKTAVGYGYFDLLAEASGDRPDPAIPDENHAHSA